MNQLISIGYTKKPHGLKGEIKLQVEDTYLDDLLEMDSLLLDIKGKHTPFFIEDLRIGNSIIAKFEDIDTPEAALSIGSKEILVKSDDLKIMNQLKLEAGFTYEDCLGFTIFDDNKEIGVIKELQEYPQQLMASLEYKGKETLIPLNDNFIKKIDQKKKHILMNLPEGLLEL